MHDTFVWDSSALMAASHADRLDVLLSLCPLPKHITTDVVVTEMMKYDAWTAQAPSLLEVVALVEPDELGALLNWEARLGTSAGHNRGEALVFAWAEVNKAMPVVDDREARNIGAANGCDLHGSLWVMCCAIREGRDTVKGR